MNDQIISTELVAVKPCRVCGAMDRYASGGACKPCANERARKHYAKNSEHILESNRKWQKSNPDKRARLQRKYYDADPDKKLEKNRKYREDNLKKVVERHRNYREENREKILERSRKWRKDNPDKGREQWRKYSEANAEKIKAAYHNRRARIKGNGGKLSKDIVQTLLIKQNNKCVCCGASLDNGYHLDHIMPIALGGMNDDQNVQLLTPKCNLSKSDKHPEVWAREKGIKLS